MRKTFYLTIVLIATILSSCKKNNSGSSASINLLKDSLFMFEKEDYLWFDAIPSYAAFNPRGYAGSSDQVALTNELTAISQLKINPATGKPYEFNSYQPGKAKYSFVDDGSQTASLNGVSSDYGFDAEYYALNDLRVVDVYPGSPAALAGLKRGYQITSINGNTSLSYDAPPYGSGTSANYNYVNNAIYNSSTISMTLGKYDGGTLTIKNLGVSSYTVNPVLKDTILTVGTDHKIGYIVFGSFTTLANAKPQLDAAFSYFIANGINDLIVDLRYNGGGSGQTAAYLDDLIAPATASGSLMYTSYFNSNLQNDHYPLLAQKYLIHPGDFKPENNQVMFSKALSLNLNRVFFIVTHNTASSSELTINNLRPVMNSVQLVGDTTYGKPVGEITIPIGKYVIYSPQEYVENSANQGGYYAGMAPGSTDYPGFEDFDQPLTDFGDPNDNLLADALTFISNGSYPARTPASRSDQSTAKTFSIMRSKSNNSLIKSHKYPLMIFDGKMKIR